MYREMINKSIENVYQAGVATKILQYMGKIRNESDITQARRWVMELLQNARDLEYPGQPVKVKIILEEDALCFLHTGIPFRVQDILSIVNQVSSKKPGEGIGQFGTGFMSTYQLSEQVQIISVLHEEGYPHKEFSIVLDRSGNSKEEILEAIERNILELEKADELPEITDYDTDDYHTEFRYALEKERNHQIARIGVEDLAATILYIMAFSEKIKSIEIQDKRPNGIGNTRYERGEHTVLSNGIEQLDLWKGEECHTLFCIRQGELVLAVEYNKEKGFLPISERTSKLFVDFPLIGSEDFPFPVILNHMKLNTNEPRSGISLVDNETSQAAKENKVIIDQAVSLFGTFVKKLLEIDTKGMEHIVSISEWKENKEWSESWVKKHLYEALYQIISQLPLLLSSKGRLPLSNPEMHLILGETEEESKAVQELATPLCGYLVPLDGIDWYQVLSGYGIPEEKVLSLQVLLEDARIYMREHLREEEMSAIDWCNTLYHAARKNRTLEAEIQSGDIMIFPSQDEEDWKQKNLHSIREIYQDPDIPEQLKDAAEKLDKLSCPGSEPTSVRRQLLHKEFELEEDSVMKMYELSKITDYIYERSSRGFSVVNYAYYASRYQAAWRLAWHILLACGPDGEMYELYQAYWTDHLPDWKPLEDERLRENLWNNTYLSILKNIIAEIEKYSNIEDMMGRLFPNIPAEEFYKWLNRFYSKCSEYLHSTEWQNKGIFPNQKGSLKALHYLALDRTSDELKGILACFRTKDEKCDIYSELLDKRIVFTNSNIYISTKQDGEIAMQLGNVIQQLLREGSLSEAELVYQEACTRLLGWIEEHPEKACEYFPSFCTEEGKMKLLTPKAAVSMHKKAKDFEKLMEELGAEDSEEIIQRIAELKQLKEKMEAQEANTPNGDSMYDPQYDVFLDEDLIAMEEGEREDALREIGNAGEQYALESIRDFFMKKGYAITEEKSGFVKLKSAQEEQEVSEVAVWRPDTESYHQSGWDIKVTLSGSDALSEEYYLEVKTHTPKSIKRGILFISDEQMKMAAAQGSHYTLLSVIYNLRTKQTLKMTAYEDLIQQLAKENLRNLNNGYVFAENALL